MRRLSSFGLANAGDVIYRVSALALSAETLARILPLEQARLADVA